MISLAALMVDRARAGASVVQDFATLPPSQMEIYFADLSPLCPDRFEMGVERRPGNALNIEIGAPLTRCKRLCPDGRGSAWHLSGGSMLAYGACGAGECPRCKSKGGGR